MFPWSPGEFKTRFVLLEARVLTNLLSELQSDKILKNLFSIAQWYSSQRVPARFKLGQNSKNRIGLRVDRPMPVDAVGLSTVIKVEPNLLEARAFLHYSCNDELRMR
jgi:hypothetical protein